VRMAHSGLKSNGVALSTRWVIGGIRRRPPIEQLVSINYTYFSFVSNLSQVLVCVNWRCISLHCMIPQSFITMTPHRMADVLPHHKHSGVSIAPRPISSDLPSVMLFYCVVFQSYPFPPAPKMQLTKVISKFLSQPATVVSLSLHSCNFMRCLELSGIAW
jgi:hypothetical protein